MKIIELFEAKSKREFDSFAKEIFNDLVKKFIKNASIEDFMGDEAMFATKDQAAAIVNTAAKSQLFKVKKDKNTEVKTYLITQNGSSDRKGLYVHFDVEPEEEYSAAIGFFNDDLEKELKKLDEGFSDYTIEDSDTASDLFHDVVTTISKKLEKELKAKHSEWNTSGPQNVGMVLVRFKSLFEFTDELDKVKTDTISALEKEREKVEKDMDDNNDGDGAAAEFLVVNKNLVKQLKRLK